MKNSLIITAIFVSLFFNSHIFAQNDISFEKLTIEDGLSQSTIISIFQDSRGFLWFGTKEGLNRYDGNNIKNYYFNSEDTTSLSDNLTINISPLTISRPPDLPSGLSSHNTLFLKVKIKIYS